MVWNSTQSALYRAVDTHNTGVFGGEKSGKKTAEKMPENRFGFDGKNDRKKTRKCCRENSSEFEPKIGCNNTRKCPCESCPKACPKNIPADPISRLLSDKDMLLIAGLIFVLMHENADKGLILALVFVLLG